MQVNAGQIPKLCYFSLLTPLLNYIREHSSVPLSEGDLRVLAAAFQPRKLKKRQFLLQEGEVCKYIAFIVKGATRQYTLDKRGREQVQNLAIENWWVADRESFRLQTPSRYYIDAWEDSEFLLLPFANDAYDRVNSIPAFKEMRIKLDDNNHMATQERLNLSHTQDAEHRYRWLTQRYPAFLQRFPQHVIASYLGITKETLSRIRQPK